MEPLCSSNQILPYLINSCHVELERVHGGDEGLDTACYVHCWVWALRVPAVPTTDMLRHLTSSQADISLSAFTGKLFIAIKATPGLAMFHCGRHAWLYQSFCSHGTLHVVVYQKLLYIWDLHHPSCSWGLLARCIKASHVAAHRVSECLPERLVLADQFLTSWFIFFGTDSVSDVCSLKLFCGLEDGKQICIKAMFNTRWSQQPRLVLP